MALIQMKGVTKKYNRGVTALRNITISVNQGEFVYLVGPSGAGKSTFIRLLYREERTTKGALKVGKFNLAKMKKREIPILRRSIGVVFQDYKLLPNKTVFENIAFAMEVIGEKPRVIKKRVTEVLDLVGLKHKMRSFPDQLSGGEQQRVAIARAISVEPTLLIFDEPTASLDVSIQARVLNLLQELKEELGLSSMFISHDLSAVQFMSERSIVLRGGKIVDRFSRDELFEDGRDQYTKDLIKLFEG